MRMKERGREGEKKKKERITFTVLLILARANKTCNPWHPKKSLHIKRHTDTDAHAHITHNTGPQLQLMA